MKALSKTGIVTLTIAAAALLFGGTLRGLFPHERVDVNELPDQPMLECGGSP